MTEDYISKLPYRPCVGIMLRSVEGKIFVGQRIDSELEAWQMPQGGIDEGEKPIDAAIRELFEETGIKSNNVAIKEESKGWYEYDVPKEIVPKLWGGRFRGQKQKWFLADFKGKDSDINIATEEPEFKAWQWVEPEKLPALIVPFKRKLYEELLEEFQDNFSTTSI